MMLLRDIIILKGIKRSSKFPEQYTFDIWMTGAVQSHANEIERYQSLLNRNTSRLSTAT